MASCPERWKWGVPKDDQPKLEPLLEGLARLRGHGLTMAVVVAALHRRRVLPLMARRRRLFEMRPGEPIEGTRMSSSALSDEEILRRVGETVDAKLRGGNLTPFAIQPSRGFLSLVSRVPLWPLSLLNLPLSLVSLCAFVVPSGDEGRALLPAARSRGRGAAGDQPHSH